MKKTLTINTNDAYKDLGNLFGLFFEDINHAADGGLYAELIQNRSFEYCDIDHPDYTPFTAWEKSDNLNWEIRDTDPLYKSNPHYLHIEGATDSYIRNTGFIPGIYLETEKQYVLSFVARSLETNVNISVSVPNLSDEHKFTIKPDKWAEQWQIIKGIFSGSGVLEISLPEGGSIEFDHISLFPMDTFKNHPNGLRPDIANALAEMKPKFMRFPGGCLVHDGSLDDSVHNSMYRWKNTIGSIYERPSRRNNWRYNQTLGLGYFEYFQFCEDIGCEPLPVLPAGFNPHKGEAVPIDELGPWIQDALDLIEFANGATDTKYGNIRANMGHPLSFNLKYLAIGNEEIGEGFFERYPYFHKAIKEKYPEIKLINSAGPFAVGEGYDAGWESAKANHSDLIDEHYYSSPEWFLGNMHHYEDYDENGPHIFLGEYASWGNTYYNAIVEAAYMTHLERSKAVDLACYAPMLCNQAYANWKPDMLFFDNHRVLKTANYYVQKMFMNYQGVKELTLTKENLDATLSLYDEPALTGIFAIQGNDVDGAISNIKIYNKSGTPIYVGRYNEQIDIKKDNHMNEIANIQDENYTVEFDFKRSAGRKGLKIFFNRKDDRNALIWEFGGWDNWDCNILSLKNGRGSTISHRIFHVTDEQYHLKVLVEGRRIRTYINDVLWNDTVDRLPEIEEIYACASKDIDGSIILKAVNLTGEAKEITVSLKAPDSQALTKVLITALRGHELTAENTFENPDLIKPVEEELNLRDNSLEYTFPAHSVCILKFMQ